jgi:uncharacterized membrane protein (UPF0127 family)
MRYLIFAAMLAACHPVTPPPADPIAATPTLNVALSPSPAAAAQAVVFGDRTIAVEIADTEESRRQGLSGRPSLAEDTGLVLWWDTPEPVGIWMPDMRFAIDVIFVRDSRVVAVYADAKPCPPSGYCPVFGPETAVDYVLEVPAGSAARWGLKTGDALTLRGARAQAATQPST